MRSNMSLASELVLESELSDLELLSQALQEAQDAHARGLIGGPGLDELQLERAARRARKADTKRLLNTRIPAEGAIA
ncbi:hypothetical protein F1721_24940 [Saccharopolyspora hirsuta]|uniref:Uncharacterized protein n=1 Tax=Saccharopolyspora hirsuta TaxID=1837 RepID=A0A5M7BT58_SACHI|nr:hypothetical protein [Saccharopolyspora hirsuta]KAA5829565.1 hypothetical protein F1721_24940 [Saccharopolyspora hirsuta]MBF6511074.1 hypothetical protein [Nocardia farcinica]